MRYGNVIHLKMQGVGASKPICRRCTMLTLKSVIYSVSRSFPWKWQVGSEGVAWKRAPRFHLKVLSPL